MSKRTKKARTSPNKQPGSQQKSPSPVSRAAEGETQAAPAPVPERPPAAAASPSVAPVSGAGISVPPGSAYQSVRPPTDEIDDAWGDASEPALVPSARLIESADTQTSHPPVSPPKSAPPESKRSQRPQPAASPGTSGHSSAKGRAAVAQPTPRAAVPPESEPCPPAVSEPKSATQGRATLSRASKSPPVSASQPTNATPPEAAQVQPTFAAPTSEATGVAGVGAQVAAGDQTSKPVQVPAQDRAPDSSPITASVSDEPTPAQPQFSADGPPPAPRNSTRAWLWVATVLVSVGVGWYLKPAPRQRDCDCRAEVQSALLAASTEAVTAASGIADAAMASAIADAPAATVDSATPAVSANDLADAAAAPLANAEYPVIVQTEAKERVDVLVKSQPSTVRILRRGKELGKTPVIIQIGRGERRVFEVSAPGYGLRRLAIGSDKPEVLVALKPLAGGASGQ